MQQIISNTVRLCVQLSQFILSVASYVRFFFHYSSFVEPHLSVSADLPRRTTTL